MVKKITVKKDTAEDDAKLAEEKKLAEQGVQDEFQAKGKEMVDYIQDHRGKVLAGLGAVVLGGLIFAIYGVVNAGRDGGASVAYHAALKSYEGRIGDAPADDSAPDGPSYKDATERAKASRDLFRAVVKEHGGTGAASLAQLYIGHTSLKLGENDEAAAAYKSYLDTTAKTDPLRFAGLQGVATALDAKGDRDGAIAALEEHVAAAGAVDKDTSLLELGRLYKAKGDTEKARKALQRIGNDFADSPLKTRAEEMLATLSPGSAEPAKDATKPEAPKTP